MRWKTHKHLAYCIAKTLGLQQDFLEWFLEGVVAPDKYPEHELKMRVTAQGGVYFKNGVVSHHKVSHRKILKYLWSARHSWLSGDVEETAYQLGCALHYMHDGYVPKSKHEWFEEALAEVPVSALWAFSSQAPLSFQTLKTVVNSVSPLSSPKQALQRAFVDSLTVTRIVLLPRELPQEIFNRHKNRKKHKIELVTAGAILFLVGATVSSVLLTAGLSLVGVSAVLLLSSGCCATAKEELGWFSSTRS
jgi:hypothetical protein